MLTAKMTHTGQSCLRLARVQNTCFGKTRNAVRIVLAAIPFFAGCAVGLDTTVGMLFVVFSCVFYYKTSFMYERDAKRAFEQTPKLFLEVEYEFGEHSFRVRSGGVEKLVGYSELQALATDQTYIYLFINGQQAYMADLRTLASGKTQELYGCLQKRTGLLWKNINVAERPSFLDFLKGNRKMDW